jgi:hypothetical protein
MTRHIRAAARRRRIAPLALALTATFGTACVKARTDPVTGKVAVDVRSPLRKGDIWTAKVSGEGTQSAATGESRAEVYQGQTTVTVRVSGLTAGGTHPWRIFQGRCSEAGGPIGEAEQYQPLVVGQEGVAEGSAKLPVELLPTRKYKVRVFASRLEPTVGVACGDLSDR